MKKLIASYTASFQGMSKETWMLSLVMLLNRIGGMVIPFLTIYLISELDFTTGEAGIVLSSFGLGGLFGSIIGGWLTDKIGSFPVQFLSLFLAAPIFILLSYLSSLIAFSLVIFLLSLINESFRPANSAAIASYAKQGNLTRSFSLNRMALNLGFSFGPALGGFLASISFTWLFYGNSIASLIAAFVFFFYFFKRKTRNEAKDLIEEQHPIAQTESPYRDKWFIIFSVFCFFYACIFFQLLIILPIFYEEHLHFSNGTIGLLLAFNGVVVFLTEMPLIQFTDSKFNIYTNLVIGGALLFIAFAWLIIDSSLISCYFSMFFLSLSEILVLPYISTLATLRSTQENRGAYMGLQGLSISLAFVIMPILATQFIEQFSYSHLWWINIFILTIVIIGFGWSRKKMPV